MTRRDTSGRANYHHGDLREALLNATERLVGEHGVAGFSVADAAREAGVSAAAPYRHFKDRAELLAQVAARGFDNLSDVIRTARDAHPIGSVDSLVAGGTAYLGFVAGRPELFHLMWDMPRLCPGDEEAQGRSRACYSVFVETLESVKAAQGLEHLGTYEFGTPLWSMVHGLASLLLSGSEFVRPDPDGLHEMVDRATRAYIVGLHSDG